MADGLTEPVSQSSAVKRTLPMGIITSYVIVVGVQDFYFWESNNCTGKSGHSQRGDHHDDLGVFSEFLGDICHWLSTRKTIY
ncbi:hypothetical protein ElyMa_005487200 [Elysia marginata]|uniref:Uncharacterized protein n=1 Tax=Elysia marginata TaxID=1093978 RepID=A0AAV4ESE9_9GAST|nr:hypothetical protein ElyMa_005487200 [Elysia marginata]